MLNYLSIFQIVLHFCVLSFFLFLFFLFYCLSAIYLKYHRYCCLVYFLFYHSIDMFHEFSFLWIFYFFLIAWFVFLLFLFSSFSNFRSIVILFSDVVSVSLYLPRNIQIHAMPAKEALRLITVEVFKENLVEENQAKFRWERRVTRKKKILKVMKSIPARSRNFS